MDPYIEVLDKQLAESLQKNTPPEHSAAWSNHGRPLTIFLVDGQTMVDHEFQKSVYKTIGPGSNPGHGNFIFYFFNIFCQAEAQNHPSTKISAKKLSVIFLSHFLPKKLQ
jgi:hypothetical protein